MTPAHQFVPRKHKTYAPSVVIPSDIDLVAAYRTIGIADSTAAKPARLIRVGYAGDVVAKLADGTTDTIYNVQVGESLVGQWVALIATGTTARQITVYW